jgi:tetratricopeptide (TPR) repeat protein
VLQETNATKQQDILARAKQHLDTASRLAPDDALPLFDLCQLYILRRSKDAATKACSEAQQMNPHYLPGALLTAQMWLLRGEWTKAEELLKAKAKEHPEDHQIGFMMVRTYLIGQRLHLAQEELDRWIKHPEVKQHDFKRLQGLIAFSNRDFSSARGYLQQAAQHDADDPEISVFLAHAKLRAGALDDDVERQLKAQLRHPIWGGYAWLALGELRRRQRRFQDAEENFVEAIKALQEGITPPWVMAEAYLQRALAWQEKHGWRHERVALYLDEAHALDIPSAELHYVRGLHALNQKKPALQDALRSLDRSLTLDPTRCDTLKALATTYTALKRRDDADRTKRALSSQRCP